jgi:hypothetical protein
VTDDHLTDEALSAVLDGAATDDERAHLDTCGPCQASLATLRRAAGAVATPPPVPSDDVRDAAITRALAAAEGGDARVMPFRRFHPALLAAAALLVVLVAAVPLLVANRGDDGTQTAAGTSERDLRASDASVGPGEDLGDLSDDAALRLILAERLGLTATDSSGSEGLFSAGGSSGAAEGSASDDAAEAAPESSVPAQAPALRAPAARATGVPPVSCTDEARDAGADRLRRLIYTAKLRYRGTPAEVLVFEAPPGQRLRHRALVMAEADCQLLVAQSF